MRATSISIPMLDGRLELRAAVVVAVVIAITYGSRALGQ
jgi:hypothetical protein